LFCHRINSIRIKDFSHPAIQLRSIRTSPFSPVLFHSYCIFLLILLCRLFNILRSPFGIGVPIASMLLSIVTNSFTKYHALTNIIMYDFDIFNSKTEDNFTIILSSLFINIITKKYPIFLIIIFQNKTFFSFFLPICPLKNGKILISYLT